MHSLHITLLCITALARLINGDFECLCNYNVETNVYPQKDQQLQSIGSLFEFDCKPTYPVSGLGTDWKAIQYEKHVGYVFMNTQLRIQTCPGNPDIADLVPTTTTIKTTPSTTKITSKLPITSTMPQTTTVFTTKPTTPTPTKPTTLRSTTAVSSTKRTTTAPTTSSTVTTRNTTPPPSTSTASTTPTTVTKSTPTTVTKSTPTTVTTTRATDPVTYRRTTRRTTTRTTRTTPTTKTTTIRATTVRIPQCPSRVPRTPFLKEYGSSCYRFIINSHAKWQDAENDCRRYGGHLVSIGSYAENMFIYNTLRLLHFHGDGDAGVWIGLTDQEREDHWRWASGEPARYTYWASDQPGSIFGSLEDCALMEMGLGGHWGDYSCDGILFSKERHGWVCEYHKI